MVGSSVIVVGIIFAILPVTAELDVGAMFFVGQRVVGDVAAAAVVVGIHY